MTRSLKLRALMLAAPLAALAGLGEAQAEWKPTRPIEFIVAAGPGGGSDQFARLVQSTIQKHQLAPVSIIVSNKGGGAGTEAFVYAKAAGSDPHKVVFSTNNEWLMPLVTKVGYKFDDLTPIAAMAVDEFVLWVNADSPIKDAKGLIQVAKEKNGSFKMGGSQAKDTDHILTKDIERATGAQFTYVPFKSGGEAAVQLAGGHIEANTNNPQENISQWRAGRVRPLCVFSPQRLVYKDKVAGDMSWNDIPTCKEAGVPVERFQMPRTVFIPGKATADQVAFYVKVLSKVRETPEWKAWLERGSQSDIFLTGKKFADFIKQDEAKNRKNFAQNGWLVSE
jgi:tripartite-type tricarboxylate transporter receptor subunit TctC